MTRKEIVSILIIVQSGERVRCVQSTLDRNGRLDIDLYSVQAGRDRDLIFSLLGWRGQI